MKFIPLCSRPLELLVKNLNYLSQQRPIELQTIPHVSFDTEYMYMKIDHSMAKAFLLISTATLTSILLNATCPFRKESVHENPVLYVQGNWSNWTET